MKKILLIIAGLTNITGWILFFMAALSKDREFADTVLGIAAPLIFISAILWLGSKIIQFRERKQQNRE